MASVNNSSDKPTVSVMLLCWNHRDFLRQCIEKLALQTDGDFEILFLDNASSDGSFEIASALFAEYSIKATLLRNETPKGISANLNKLLAHATGELVCPLSTDDWYRPRFVEAMKDAAANESGASWFYGTRSSYSEEDGELVEAHDYVDGDVRQFFLRADFRVNMNGCVYRRDALESIGGWDETLQLEDVDLMLRLSEVGQCHRIDEPLATYRSHPSGASKNPDFMVQGLREFFSKHRMLYPSQGKPALADSIRQMAAWFVDTGELRQARRLLWTAFRTDPLNRDTLRTSAYLGRRYISRLASRTSNSPNQNTSPPKN